jgi:hypothetical protein
MASWQIWLSQRPTRRTNTSHEPIVFAVDDAIKYEFLREDDGRHIVRETHYISKESVRKGLSGPPL